VCSNEHAQAHNSEGADLLLARARRGGVAGARAECVSVCVAVAGAVRAVPSRARSVQRTCRGASHKPLSSSPLPPSASDNADKRLVTKLNAARVLQCSIFRFLSLSFALASFLSSSHSYFFTKQTRPRLVHLSRSFSLALSLSPITKKTEKIRL
jgi:hypothetical protein